MGAHSFQDLIQHHGHKIVCVTYGKPPYDNVAIECEDCSTVLLDFDNVKYVNYYRCSNDGHEWQDEWDSMCNDRCPVCNAEIEPYDSDALLRSST